MLQFIGVSYYTVYSTGDLLENYCWNDDLMNVSRISFSITILLTFPIECFVIREVIENSFFSNLTSPEDKWRTLRHVGITIMIVITTYLISMATDCLGVVLELNVSEQKTINSGIFLILIYSHNDSITLKPVKPTTGYFGYNETILPHNYMAKVSKNVYCLWNLIQIT